MAGKKRAIRESQRRELALKSGGAPGETTVAPCHYCGALGRICWFRLRDGRPGAWVSFDHEIDHVIPESLGGSGDADNLVLACRTCNRKKGARDALVQG